VVDGANYQTEQMLPRSWSYGHSDLKYIRSVNARYGGRRLRTYQRNTLFQRKIWFPYVKRLEKVQILNYVPYEKEKVIELMKKELGWVSYGDKHHEAIYTRFYQSYILPTKFGADKRRVHLSCLINNGEITRDGALAKLQQPPIDAALLNEDRDFVLKKLGLSESEFEAIMQTEPKSYWDFPSYGRNPPLYDRVWDWSVKIAGKAALAPLLIRRAGSFSRSAVRKIWSATR